MTSTPAGAGSGSGSGAGDPIVPSTSQNIPPTPSQSSSGSSNTNRNNPATHPATAAQPAPRKNQASRRQHRQSRRPAGSTRYDEDDFAEMKALNSANSRRGQTSITHLLNFAAPIRLDYDHSAYARSYRKQPTWGPGSGYHAVDKARYVHANYRFIVSPTSSYASQASNADVQVDWGHVLQVVASSISQSSSCPVCLSEPVAPRMAKCGHIFCLPCVMHYMATLTAEEEDEKRKFNRGPRWKKCPICDDHIYTHDLRPVRFYAGQESALPKPGDDVILRLMARNSKSTLALPRSDFEDELDSGDTIPWHFASNVLDYARVMRGTIDYMSEQHDEEIAALLEMENADGLLYGDSNEWTQKAIASVRQSKLKLGEIILADDNSPSAESASATTTTTAAAAAAAKAAVSSSKKPAEPSSSSHDFFFYSAPPHLYLSPLDIRMLKTAFGSFDQFPSTLLPRVEHISTGHAVDDAMRKRAKYLGHLPRGCLISFLECDWSDILPAETLVPFADEIRRRRKANTDKIAQEDREKAQAERREQAALRSNAARRYDYDPFGDHDNYQPQHPPVDLNDFQPLPGTSPPVANVGLDALAAEPDALEIGGGLSVGRTTVWGTRAVAGEAGEGSSSAAYGAVDDGWLRDEDLMDAELARQLEQIQLAEAGVATEGADGGGSGGKKKKKKQKQKITLMSTGSRRAM